MGCLMINVQERAKKVAFEQGISEEEAMELVQMLMGQEPTNSLEDSSIDGENLNEGLNTDNPVSEEESYDSLEMDAVEKDFDFQMANDNGEDLEQPQNDLAMAVAKLRQAKKNRKVAELPPDDPKKQQFMDVQNEVLQEHANDPNLDAETLQTGLSATEELLANLAGTADPEEIRVILESNLGLNTVATKRFASWADARFGVPEDEGKIYRSWVNPLYFKTAKGNIYKLALDPYAEEEGIQDPVEPSPAPAPAPEQPQEDPISEQQHTLDEQEKQRLSQLMADAEAQGTSSFKLIGLVNGFLGDKSALGIASSQQEINEMNEGFRLGQQARGTGSSVSPAGGQTTAKKVRSAPVNQHGGPGAGAPAYPSSGNAPVAPAVQQNNVDPNQQQNMGDVTSILDQVTTIMNDPNVDDQTKFNQVANLINGGV